MKTFFVINKVLVPQHVILEVYTIDSKYAEYVFLKTVYMLNIKKPNMLVCFESDWSTNRRQRVGRFTHGREAMEGWKVFFKP